VAAVAAWGPWVPGAGAQSTVSASIGSTPTGAPMPSGFVGVSLEYSALHLYTGRDPRAIDPVLLNLLRALAPGQAPVLRIGGNSADASWWPIRGMIPPVGVTYAITPGWLRTTQALAKALGARLIMGVNLAGGRAAIAATEARAFLQGIGRRYVSAFEIGNEPDVYNVFPWFYDRASQPVYARDASWTLQTFTQQFAQWRAAMPVNLLAGPAFAERPWTLGIGSFLSAEPRLTLVTMHRYPLRAGVTDPTSPIYASIPTLLNDQASAGLAQGIAASAALAHSYGRPFRIDEMNSAAHYGQKGVSDAFASALWALDTLFNFRAVGVDGVNFHSLPNANYELFTLSRPHKVWQAFVHPVYYGMLMFAQAFPAGARMLPVTVPNGPVKVWATQSSDGHIRVVVINKDYANPSDVQLQVPGANIAGQARLDWLEAPNVASTSGVTLGGQTFGTRTRTGSLGSPQYQPVLSVAGSYTVHMPPASAVMLLQ